MTDIETAIHHLLSTDERVRQSVGLDASGQPMIAPGTIDQGATKGIAYHEISSTSEEHLSGAIGLAQTRLQFDCIAPTRLEAQEIREAVRDRLQSYRGLVASLWIRWCSVAGRRGGYDQPGQGEDSGRFVKSIDFLITHEEAT